MDSRVRTAVLGKIDETLLEIDEISDIEKGLKGLYTGDPLDFAFGVALGRIYNSFHYQTRRILKRNATEEEFGEFREMLLSGGAKRIRDAITEMMAQNRGP